MKMVRHKAPRQHIGIGQNVLFNFLQKKQVVLPAKENTLAVIALIVNMV